MVPRRNILPTRSRTKQMTKTVLITGAGRGLGLQFTAHYIESGWKVIATARSLASADELKALAPWKTVTLDASNEESILSTAHELQGVAIDLVINNAGILTSNGLDNSTKDDLMQQFEVNAVGPFLVTRALLPNLKLAAQANGYAIVSQISSRMGSIALNESGGYIGYRASKTALNMISTSLANDLAEHKIGVVMLHPGYVSTDMSSGVGDITPQQSIQYLSTILDRVDLKDSGNFFHYEGFELQW